MAVEIRVPSSGESVVEATVGRWYKQPGQAVTADEDVVELETDKVNITIPAGADGVLQSIMRQTGETVAVNDVLGTVTPGVAASNGTSNGASAPTDGAQATPAKPPTAAAATVATPAPAATTPSAPAAKTAPNGEDLGDANAPATPLAAKMLEQHGLKASNVPGTGPNGKITRDDVQNHVATASAREQEKGEREKGKGISEPSTLDAQRSTLATPNTQPPTLDTLNPLLSDERRETVTPMSRMRKTIAAKLVEAQQTAAMLTTFNEVDMTAVMDVRTRRKDKFKEKHGVNLGFMSFFTKAVIGALKTFPYLNAEINGDNIIEKHYYDIGIAVGTERGLMVPVVRNADKLTFAGIEKEIGALAVKARENKLGIADLAGGTFTITNGGVYGSLMSTPILNAPQVGILGMHKIEERPIAMSGQVVIRPMMYLALSYDHRIVDGSEAVRFLVKVKELLEDPESLLLEG